MWIRATCNLNFQMGELNHNEGLSLLELAPELIGSEDELTAILAGDSEGYQLPLVNRISEDDRIVYANFTVLPHIATTVPATDTNGASKGLATGTIDGLIFVVADVTDFARIEQEVTQHRNELSLLRDQLARQRSSR